jgi:dihydrofolate reductase
MSWNGIEIVHVVALDNKHCIGVDNQLPWHLPADLQHFKQITQGGVIVMGRKTFDSLGRLLPNRSHWVLTRQTDWQHDGVHVAQDLNALLNGAAADAVSRGQSALYIIGGGDLFSLTLPLADRLEITHVALDVHGHVHYPDLPITWVADDHDSPPLVDEKTDVLFRFVTYRRAQ